MKRNPSLEHDFGQSNKRRAPRKAYDASASSSSATLVGSDNYDVFLNFYGKDTRKTFVSHLYNGLVDAGIRVFKDDNELRQGKEIGNNLFQAINNSKISIPILSLNYASSQWCLQELVEMIECMKSVNQVVLPIFYWVEPAHVRYQKGRFGEIFSNFCEKYIKKDIAKWKKALEDVASLKGWESKRDASGDEGELVKMVVRKVFSELKKAFQLVVTEQLVGINNSVEYILRLLDNNPCATQIVGIHGMGGIGKTTLAKVVYNKLSNKFEHRSFIADIRESSQRKGISCMQNQIISDILKMKNQVSNTDEGIRIMESRFKHKKVLILLDDVDHIDQLKALVGKCEWFEMGSKILITTRKRFVLHEHGVKCQYKLKEIAKVESLILFSRHAFLRDFPPCEFMSLSRAIVSCTGGLPLALEVIGSSLCGRNQAFWQDALKKLKETPHEKVQEKLMISYNALSYAEKEIFLDIACFFIGHDLKTASYMWDACNYHPRMGIETLIFMSLIKIGVDGKVKMHDQLRDLGREIVRQEGYNTSMHRSRLWDPKEALEVLQSNKAQEKDRVQLLRLGDRSGSEITAEQFETLPNLRFLSVNGATLIGDSKSLLPNLRWLQWSGYNALVVTSFHLEKLVVLDLSSSAISRFWEGWSHLEVAKHLKVLILKSCKSLRVTPDLSAFGNLEILILKKCRHLEKIHPSIEKVKGLVLLDLGKCYKLKELPQQMGELKELEELSISGTGIKELPPSIGSLKKLKVLDASHCKSLIRLPDSIGKLKWLTKLWFLYSGICVLPESVGYLKKLELINVCDCKSLIRLPDSIGKLERLTELRLIDSGICELPESVGDLKNLKFLILTGIKGLRNLPRAIGKLGKLEILHAAGCTNLGGEVPINSLSSLRTLHLNYTCVSGFLGEFDEHFCLEELDLFTCKKLRSLPQSINKLPSLKDLTLSHCEELQSLPELPASLTTLSVTCQSQTLPQLSHLIRLRHLFIESCPLLESIPELPSRLSMLSICSCGELMEMKGLEALKYLPMLIVTRCSKLFFSNLDGLEHLESLRTLCVSEISVCDAPLLNNGGFQAQGLDRLKNLGTLRLWGCRSQDLWQIRNRKQLSFGECRNLVKIKGLERMKKLKRLEVVWSKDIENLPGFSRLDDDENPPSKSYWTLCDV